MLFSNDKITNSLKKNLPLGWWRVGWGRLVIFWGLITAPASSTIGEKPPFPVTMSMCHLEQVCLSLRHHICKMKGLE